jgi:hypothetical protein
LSLPEKNSFSLNFPFLFFFAESSPYKLWT